MSCLASHQLHSASILLNNCRAHIMNIFTLTISPTNPLDILQEDQVVIWNFLNLSPPHKIIIRTYTSTNISVSYFLICNQPGVSTQGLSYNLNHFHLSMILLCFNHLSFTFSSRFCSIISTRIYPVLEHAIDLQQNWKSACPHLLLQNQTCFARLAYLMPHLTLGSVCTVW